MLDDILNTITEFIRNDGVFLLAIIVVVAIFQRYTFPVLRSIFSRVLATQKFHSQRDRNLREKTLVYIFGTAIIVIVWLSALLLVMRHFGINLTPILASAGFLSLAIGFGAQSLVKDYISGIFILIENQYRVGDVVEINKEISGTVESFTLRMTALRDLDGQINYIANNQITLVTNMTMDFSNINLDIGVGYDTDIDKLEKLINEVGQKLKEDEEFGPLIIEPPSFLRIKSFEDSSILVKIVGKTEPSEQWRVTGELRKRLLNAYRKNDIEIPFPQRVMHDGKKSSK